MAIALRHATMRLGGGGTWAELLPRRLVHSIAAVANGKARALNLIKQKREALFDNVGTQLMAPSLCCFEAGVVDEDTPLLVATMDAATLLAPSNQFCNGAAPTNNEFSDGCNGGSRSSWRAVGLGATSVVVWWPQTNDDEQFMKEGAKKRKYGKRKSNSARENLSPTFT
ncbi:hypothetical protein ZWY2020_001457 [Hordeum vulgare]|nr:hypothetical protein ZWY2020_001457 [Hordeum vulgare]